MGVLRFMGIVLFGIILHVAIDLILIGTVFVLRSAIIFYYNFDIMSWFKKFENKDLKKSKKILNEDGNEWLKTRGKY